MSALLAVPALFSGPYRLLARAAIVLLVALALFVFSWVKGNQSGVEDFTDYKAKQAVATIKLAAARTEVVREVEIKYRDRIQTVTVKGDEIIKEVTKYVPIADDARCDVPDGFVRVHNAAWTNTPAGPPAESDRGSSGIPLAEIAEASAVNASACFRYKEQRDGLIEFYTRLKALE